MIENVAVLILTCDKYEPYWTAFYTLFLKYWNNCPFTIYHSSETAEFKSQELSIKNIQTQLPKKPSYWSEGFYKSLQTIKEKYVILFLDDFFITNYCNNTIIEEYLQILESDVSLKCLRFLPIPDSDKNYENSDKIGLHTKEHFRISTQTAIWDKEYLMQLLLIGENPWEFEDNASKRSMNIAGNIAVILRGQDYPITYFNAIIQNKLTRAALHFCENHSIYFDKNKIQVNTKIEEFYWKSKSRLIRKFIDFIQKRIFPIKQLL